MFHQVALCVALSHLLKMSFAYFSMPLYMQCGLWVGIWALTYIHIKMPFLCILLWLHVLLKRIWCCFPKTAFVLESLTQSVGEFARNKRDDVRGDRLVKGRSQICEIRCFSLYSANMKLSAGRFISKDCFCKWVARQACSCFSSMCPIHKLFRRAIVT